MKTVTILIALLVASHVNAAWQPGHVVSNNQAGELLLTVWNQSTGAAIQQDLNLFVSDLFYSTGSFDNKSVSIDADAMNYVGVGDIRFSVAGANYDKRTIEFNRDLFPVDAWRDNRGVVFTANQAPSETPLPVVVVESAVAYNFEALLAVRGQSIPGNSSDVLIGNFGGASWGSGLGSLGSNFGFSASSPLGSAITMYGLQLADDRGPLAPISDEMQLRSYGTWTLNADNTLTYSIVASEVPVPSAFWLLGSALLGLIRLRFKNV